MNAARRLTLAGCFFLLASTALAQEVIVVKDYKPLPNECAIVATEAVARLRKAGIDARILEIAYLQHFDLSSHAMVVWRLPGSDRIAIYDDYFLGGTIVLGTNKFDAFHIATSLMVRKHLLIVNASLW